MRSSSLAIAAPAGAISPRRELSVQGLYEEAESLRRILQAQTAVELLLQTGNGKNVESLLETLDLVGAWIRDLDQALRDATESNALARELLPVVDMARQVQAALIVATVRRRPSADGEIRALHGRLVDAVALTDGILRGTSAEIRSFSAGCACESDRLAEMRRS